MQQIQKSINWIISKVYLDILNLEFEKKKHSIIRVLCGLFIVARTTTILYTNYYITGSNNFIYDQWFGLIFIGLGTLLTLGLFSNFVVIALILFLTSFDNEYGCRTLGTTQFVSVLTLLYFSNLYSTFKINFKNSFLQKLNTFNIFNIPQTKGYVLSVYVLAMCAYGVVNIISIVRHLGDDYWTTGNTVRILFTNEYLSNFTGIFRYLDYTFPTFSWIFSAIGGFFQTIFQLLMVPLLFTKIGSKFVKIQSFLFFVFSLIFIKLSLLPYYEIFLWVIIYFGNKIEKSKFEEFKVQFFHYYYVLLLGLYLSFNTYKIGDFMLKVESKLTGVYRSNVVKILYRLGFDTPNVFNHIDLKMGTRFVCLYDSENNLLPLLTEEGNRMNTHFSDQFYFGTSLKINRALIQKPIEAKEDLKVIDHYLNKVFSYFFYKEGLKTFKVVVYKNNAGSIEFSKNKFDNNIEFSTIINFKPTINK